MSAQHLDPRLQALLDKQEIHECAVKAFRAMDRHDSQLWREAWHPDATDDHGGWIGPAAEFIEKSLLRAPRWRRHYHNPFNQTIDLNGDIAHVETYYFAVLLHLGDDESDFSAVRYRDRVERRDGIWKIAHRLTVLDWTGTLSAPRAAANSKIPDGSLFTHGTWDQSDPLLPASARAGPSLARSVPDVHRNSRPGATGQFIGRGAAPQRDPAVRGIRCADAR